MWQTSPVCKVAARLEKLIKTFFFFFLATLDVLSLVGEAMPPGEIR